VIHVGAVLTESEFVFEGSPGWMAFWFKPATPRDVKPRSVIDHSEIENELLENHPN